MPLPEYGTVPVHGGSVDPKPAHLIRFPEHLVEQLDAMACNGEKFMISMEGGPVSHTPVPTPIVPYHSNADTLLADPGVSQWRPYRAPSADYR